jgi:hypothetical protein
VFWERFIRFLRKIIGVAHGPGIPNRHHKAIPDFSFAERFSIIDQRYVERGTVANGDFLRRFADEAERQRGVGRQVEFVGSVSVGLGAGGPVPFTTMLTPVRSSTNATK